MEVCEYEMSSFMAFCARAGRCRGRGMREEASRSTTGPGCQSACTGDARVIVNTRVLAKPALSLPTEVLFDAEPLDLIYACCRGRSVRGRIKKHSWTRPPNCGHR